MSEQEWKQEYQFIMDGITTRMQIALEKMAESNKLMHRAAVWSGIVTIVVVVVLGYIILKIAG